MPSILPCFEKPFNSDTYSGFGFLSKRILAAAVLPSDGRSAEPRPDNSPASLPSLVENKEAWRARAAPVSACLS